jgi:hypothetical protein
VAQPAPLVPPNSVSVHFRYAYRVGSESEALAPNTGLSVGGEFERRLLAFDSGIELGGAVDFFYDRFSKDVIASSPGPTGEELMIVTRSLSHTTFALLGTAAWRYSDMRLFTGIGGGLSVGHYGGGPSASPGTSSTTDMQGVARGVLGFDFAISKLTAAVLRVEYNRILNQSVYIVAPGGTTYPLFGDIFNAGIGLLVRF